MIYNQNGCFSSSSSCISSIKSSSISLFRCPGERWQSETEESICTGWWVETCWDLASTMKSGMLVNDFLFLRAPHYGGRRGSSVRVPQCDSSVMKLMYQLAVTKLLCVSDVELYPSFMPLGKSNRQEIIHPLCSGKWLAVECQLPFPTWLRQDSWMPCLYTYAKARQRPSKFSLFISIVS